MSCTVIMPAGQPRGLKKPHSPGVSTSCRCLAAGPFRRRLEPEVCECLQASFVAKYMVSSGAFTGLTSARKDFSRFSSR